MVLILTNKQDVSADFVVRELRKRNVEFWRLNLEDAPWAAFTANPGQQLWLYHPDGGECADFGVKLRSVWYRRPGTVGDDTLEDPVWAFVNDQWSQLIRGLTALPGVLWVNDPYANQRAECKLLQLSFAKEIGLNTPRTCITNDAQQFAAFRAACNHKIVVKALYAPLIEAENSFIFTHLLSNDEPAIAEELRLSPVICQEALVPKLDLRVTVVGKRLFVAQLETLDSDPVDWRQLPHEGNWRQSQLPNDIAEKIFALTDRLGLRFAGIDLIYHDGEYVFVEVNPNGEWGWLQTQADLPIAEALADLLAEGTVQGSA